MPCYSPLKGYKCKETGGLVFKREQGREKMEVACGQCLGCRLDRSRMWAMRITHEASLYDSGLGNSFVTLTYRPESVPENESLRPRDYTLFMKRLRKRFNDRKIKYYQCGEYGNRCKHGFDLSKQTCPLCNHGRPHHHAILFNLRPDDLEPYATDGETIRYTSPELEKLWGHGFVDVGPVVFETAAYVARYIMKKVTGDLAEHHYQRYGYHGEIHKIEPEYSTMSNGIGEKWYERYRSDCFPSDETPVPGQGVIPKVPRFYADKLKAEDPEMYEYIKTRRLKHKLKNADEYTPERLYSKYKVKMAQVGNDSLNRGN